MVLGKAEWAVELNFLTNLVYPLFNVEFSATLPVIRRANCCITKGQWDQLSQPFLIFAEQWVRIGILTGQRKIRLEDMHFSSSSVDGTQAAEGGVEEFSSWTSESQTHGK